MEDALKEEASFREGGPKEPNRIVELHMARVNISSDAASAIQILSEISNNRREIDSGTNVNVPKINIPATLDGIEENTDTSLPDRGHGLFRSA